ncbi:hypothetical protein C5B42_04815 [Candidatus Cerribacteria bacterium 'Amazon FNV 2010 28 9']|uniref:Uncharacterized protein n=1 Tax=Candidatus Cerribacteria bacterium 'Amazon FNV 2010 28 9' TaxID=2081795 RepID=A0A317JNX8_9BACT|nr:MAG: hypothetical protein C5B42_04815 [Candidatus Cerribacteria bacterium 'Amazon FNV 2010 28 9']
MSAEHVFSLVFGRVEDIQDLTFTLARTEEGETIPTFKVLLPNDCEAITEYNLAPYFRNAETVHSIYVEPTLATTQNMDAIRTWLKEQKKNTEVKVLRIRE